MENAYVVDIETDGLLDTMTKIHCMVIRKLGDDGYIHVCNDQGGAYTVRSGLQFIINLVSHGAIIIFHNGIKFDYEAIRKLHPDFYIPEEQIFDTIVAARLMFPDRWEADAKLVIRENYPKRLSNKHSLEAWGYRLHCHKGEYEGDTRIEDLVERKRTKWMHWNPDMEAYCIQDTEVTGKLYKMLIGLNYSQEAIELEHQVQWIIAAQERHGVRFDVDAAVKLSTELVQRKLEITDELTKTFTPMFIGGKLWTPKRDNRRLGYCEGATLQEITLTEFTPSNRHHIVRWLQKKYGWKPEVYGNDGHPKMDEVILEGLQYPEVELLKEYLVVDKRLAAVANGKEAWLKHVSPDGRMHGNVITNGAVTGRATHSKPNLGQVPAVYSPYGSRCRALFLPDDGHVLVGADQSGVEGRCLGNYMAIWDDGAYCSVILEGDIHATNQEAAGLATRDNAKTFFYAFIYGAGNEKIGKIVGKDAKEGKRLRAKFLKGLPALKQLIKAVKFNAEKYGYLKGLDKRRIPIRHVYCSLNTLLQSAGALLAKKSMVIMRDKVRAAGYEGVAHQVIWNHDEHQWSCPKEIAEDIGRMQVEAYREAGEHFKFRIPIDGEYKIGNNWAETH